MARLRRQGSHGPSASSNILIVLQESNLALILTRDFSRTTFTGGCAHSHARPQPWPEPTEQPTLHAYRVLLVSSWKRPEHASNSLFALCAIIIQSLTAANSAIYHLIFWDSCLTSLKHNGIFLDAVEQAICQTGSRYLHHLRALPRSDPS